MEGEQGPGLSPHGAPPGRRSMTGMRPTFSLLVVAVVALVACSGPDESASGEEIYMQLCSRCHGAELGGGIGPALGPGSNAAEQSDDYLIVTIRDGRGRMPSFRQTLSEAQIGRVVEYLRQEQRSS
nr:cytochrome c [Acidimicrobiia bacterium]